MKRQILTIVALMCCVTFQVKAQENAAEMQKTVLQEVEKLAQDADKNPKNGKKQLAAARSFCWDDLGDKQDFDRALTYANKALKIAEAQKVPADTLLGGAYLILGHIYLKKSELEKSLDCYEKGLQAIENELGRFNRFTIYEKLEKGNTIMTAFDARRGALLIQEAFLDNERAPLDMRIKNIDYLGAIYEMAIDFLVADMTLRMQRGLPQIVFEGKRYFILETPEWNMDQPIVGWLAPQIISAGKGQTEQQEGDIILMEDNSQNTLFRVIKPDDESRPQFKVSFVLNEKDHSMVSLPEDNARLWFLDEKGFQHVLDKYHEFKAQQK